MRRQWVNQVWPHIDTDPKATLPDLPEVLAAHQQAHLRQTGCHITTLARRGWSDAKILADLTPT